LAREGAPKEAHFPFYRLFSFPSTNINPSFSQAVVAALLFMPGASQRLSVSQRRPRILRLPAVRYPPVILMIGEFFAPSFPFFHVPAERPTAPVPTDLHRDRLTAFFTCVHADLVLSPYPLSATATQVGLRPGQPFFLLLMSTIAPRVSLLPTFPLFVLERCCALWCCFALIFICGRIALKCGLPWLVSTFFSVLSSPVHG